MGERDYEPIALTSLCNAGIEVVGDRAPVGEVELRGLPFLIGTSPDRCFVVLGERRDTHIAVEREAHWVIFAHRLLASRLVDGGPVGDQVARYRFVLADGSSHPVPVRERYEIGQPAHRKREGGWGLLPALALPDNQPGPPPRLHGYFGRAGAASPEAPTVSRRPTELHEGLTHYYLWVWRNPHPEIPLLRVEITAAGPPFLVAGVTISHLEEHPLVPTGGAIPIRVDLDGDHAGDVFDLSLTVDRGVATYPYALVDGAAPAAEFVGWGEPGPAATTSAYAHVAALPSATLTVRHGEEIVGQAGWRELLGSREVQAASARLRVVELGRNWVRTTVADVDTGQPLPCRIHFRSADGVPYQPYGHHSEVGFGLESWHSGIHGDVRLGALSYAYVDGNCEGWLPRGDVVVEAARGFEYEPVRTRVHVADDQRTLRIELRRWRDMNAEGWYSGDTHVHFLPTVGSQLEARGEDLNVVNLLATQWGGMFTGIEEFTGRPAASADGRTITHVSQESRQHFLGHLSLLGLSEPVLPWCSDGPVEAELGGTLEVTLSELADRCHALGGTVVLPHLPNPNGELAALIATGRLDAVEMAEHQGYAHREYYRYLNGGYRVPLVGGTDKMSPDVPVGLMRTYVHIPDEEFSYPAWCRSLRAGRTFVSSGPLLSLTVEGAGIGDVVRLPSTGGEVEVHVRAESAIPIHCLQLVAGGAVVDATESETGTRRLELRARVPVTANTWIAARVGGPGYDRPLRHQDAWKRGVMAHTSPVYLVCGEGEWTAFNADSLQHMLTLIDISRSYTQAMSLQHPAGSVMHHHGRHDHLDHLDRPFREAREAVLRRLDEGSRPAR